MITIKDKQLKETIDKIFVKKESYKFNVACFEEKYKNDISRIKMCEKAKSKAVGTGEHQQENKKENTKINTTKQSEAVRRVVEKSKSQSLGENPFRKGNKENPFEKKIEKSERIM